MSIGGPKIYFLPKRVGRSDSSHTIAYFSFRKIEKAFSSIVRNTFAKIF